MMPSEPENRDEQLKHGSQNILPSTAYSQPWWRGLGSSTSPGESTFQIGLLNKDQDIGPENQDGRYTAASAMHSMGNVHPSSHMELVGHSIILTPCTFPDPQCGGIVGTYGPQAMLPQFYGAQQGRMLLPLEMEEEPVYVNAKQYHGILRRRQLRAKAELEKKVVKARKPYLHESRHLHAMRRARGCGGRFLSNKKPDNNSDPKPVKNSSTASSMESLPSDCSGDKDSSSDLQEISGFATQNLHKAQALSNGSFEEHGLSLRYQMQFSDGKEGDCLSQQRDGMQINGATRGPIPIQ